MESSHWIRIKMPLKFQMFCVFIYQKPFWIPGLMQWNAMENEIDAPDFLVFSHKFQFSAENSEPMNKFTSNRLRNYDENNAAT